MKKIIAIAILALSFFQQCGMAADRIIFKSGATMIGTVVEYRDGILSVIDESGEERKGQISAIDSIVFMRDEIPLPATPVASAPATTADPADEAEIDLGKLTAADVIARADVLEGRQIEVSGIIARIDRDALRHDAFVIVLQEGLILRINRTIAEDEYLKLKKLSRTGTPFFGINYVNVGALELKIELQKKQHAHDRLGRRREEILDRISVLNRDDKITIRGSVVRKGNSVLLEKVELLEIP